MSLIYCRGKLTIPIFQSFLSCHSMYHAELLKTLIHSSNLTKANFHNAICQDFDIQIVSNNCTSFFRIIYIECKQLEVVSPRSQIDGRCQIQGMPFSDGRCLVTATTTTTPPASSWQLHRCCSNHLINKGGGQMPQASAKAPQHQHLQQLIQKGRSLFSRMATTTSTTSSAAFKGQMPIKLCSSAVLLFFSQLY